MDTSKMMLLKKDALVKIAKEKNLTGYSKLSKKKLVEFIQKSETTDSDKEKIGEIKDETKLL